MVKKITAVAGFVCLLIVGCFPVQAQVVQKTGHTFLMKGESVSLARKGKQLFITTASGDSIFYAFSVDERKSFSSPQLVAVQKGLVSVGGRGPQIACTKNGLVIIAPDTAGNLQAYTFNSNTHHWKKGGYVNDLPGVAPEAFVSVAPGAGNILYATWLDLRLGHKNNVYFAQSSDGGASWLKNKLVYQSPGGSVCECCKPSIAANGDEVAILFRNNWLGNRDLYFVRRKKSATEFGPAEKLGADSWKLNGCPMDGGGLAFRPAEGWLCIWRREGSIYTGEPGKKETLLATGRQCAIAAGAQSFYTCFVNGKKVYLSKPGGNPVELGEGGSYPKLIATAASSLFCAWELDNKIYGATIHI